MSLNIRAAGLDSREHAWEQRRHRVASLIDSRKPAVLGLQEVLLPQRQDLAQDLVDYRLIGEPSLGGRAGEYVPIAYRPAAVELRQEGTFWCSPTPEVPASIGWGNVLPSQVTWAILAHRRTGAPFLVLNTHFSFQSRRCRIESARLVRRFVTPHAHRGLPVVLLGDLNAAPGSEAYLQLVAGDGDGTRLHDCWNLAEHRTGPEGTFHGFTGVPRPGRIDHILCHPALAVSRLEVLLVPGGPARQPSDHCPVMAVLTLPQPLFVEERSILEVSARRCPDREHLGLLRQLLETVAGVRRVDWNPGGGARVVVAPAHLDRPAVLQAILTLEEPEDGFF